MDTIIADTRAMTIAMCWRLVAKFVDPSTGIGAAIFQKPTTNDCYEKREKDFPPMCEDDDKPDDAWYTLLQIQATSFLFMVQQYLLMIGDLWYMLTQVYSYDCLPS